MNSFSPVPSQPTDAMLDRRGSRYSALISSWSQFAPNLSCARGTAMVESVIIFPLIVFFIIAIIDLSNSLFHHEVLTQVARESARMASSVPRLNLGTVQGGDSGGLVPTCQFAPPAGVFAGCALGSKYLRLINRSWENFLDWERREQLRVVPGTRLLTIENYIVQESAGPPAVFGNRVRVRVRITYDAFFSYQILYGAFGDRVVEAQITLPKL